MSEAGVPGFESIISQGLFAPAGTPDDIVVKVNATVNQIMGGKEMAARAQQLKVEPRAYTSAEYQAWLADQAVAWAKLIKDAGIKLE
jgi:tripartite-type tricarboxylate transporter receptor subunit TctC